MYTICNDDSAINKMNDHQNIQPNFRRITRFASFSLITNIGRIRDRTTFLEITAMITPERISRCWHFKQFLKITENFVQRYRLRFVWYTILLRFDFIFGDKLSLITKDWINFSPNFPFYSNIFSEIGKWMHNHWKRLLKR